MWKIEYDWDDYIGHDENEYFWERWTVTNGVRVFECKTEDDAKYLVALLSAVQE